MIRQSKQTELSDEHFIRHRLYGGNKSSWRRYAALVLAKPGFLALVRYELLSLFVIHFPGALGLALRKVLIPRLLGASGRGAIFGRSIAFRHPEHIRVGAGALIDDYCLIDAHGAEGEGLVLGERVVVNRGACLQAKVGPILVGDDTSIGGGSKIISQGPITIGRNVSIAADAVIAGGRYVVTQGTEAGEKRRFTGGKITIGDHVRIGVRSIIQDGVSIGEGAIVAPGSVVISDVTAYTVVSGNPARPWRERRQRDEIPTRATSADDRSAGGAAIGHGRPADEAVREQVRQYLAATHFAVFGPDELSDESSLFDQHILDSVALVSLVTWIETTFGVSAEEEELLPENLETVERIEAFITDRRETSARQPAEDDRRAPDPR